MNYKEILDEQEIKSKRLKYKRMRILAVMMGSTAFCIIPILGTILYEFHYESYIYYSAFEYLIISLLILTNILTTVILFQISYAYLKLKTNDILIIKPELNRIYKKRNIVSLFALIAIILFIITDLYI